MINLNALGGRSASDVFPYSCRCGSRGVIGRRVDIKRTPMRVGTNGTFCKSILFIKLLNGNDAWEWRWNELFGLQGGRGGYTYICVFSNHPETWKELLNVAKHLNSVIFYCRCWFCNVNGFVYRQFYLFENDIKTLKHFTFQPLLPSSARYFDSVTMFSVRVMR